MKKINNNDLIPWFTQDHKDLPDSYLKSCQKFFDKIKQAPAAPYKNFFWPTVPQRQAASSEQVTAAPECDIKKIER